MKRKRFFIAIVILFTVTLIAIFYCNKHVSDSAEGKLFSKTGSIPYNKVGLLLGTSKYLQGGALNLYYTHRIEAAVELFRDSKIKYIIISGDNGHRAYNEPEMMRADLIKAGVDSLHIFLDYAGFRTFDSMIRVKEIFGQSSVTVISQQFHNERAIYTASKLGVTAIGFNAADVSAYQGFKTKLREKLARVKVMLDFWFGNKPKFLGDKITIPA